MNQFLTVAALLFLYASAISAQQALRGVVRDKDNLLEQVQTSPTTLLVERETFDPRQLQQEDSNFPDVDFVGNGQNNLGLCQGDCDNDADCEGDLECFQRDSNDPVPGCRGGEDDARCVSSYAGCSVSTFNKTTASAATTVFDRPLTCSLSNVLISLNLLLYVRITQ